MASSFYNELLEFWVASQSSYVVAPSIDRQTTHRQEELALRPEHEERYAYVWLSLLPYPISLPWDKWFEEARHYLNYLGVPLHHLVAVFMLQPQQSTSAEFDLWQHRQAQWCNEQVVRAHLGLTVPLYDLIAKDIPLTTENPFGSYFLKTKLDLFNISQLTDEKISLGTFMKCLGLWRGDAQGDTGAKDFELVREILGCRYVNPNNGIQLTYQKQSENDALCNPANYRLTNLTFDFLVRLTKFEHLRRILGCRPRELNQAILVLDKQGTLDETVLQLISHLVRLQQKRAKISVMELLSWWGPIETGANWLPVGPFYEGEKQREESLSLYKRVFLNKSLYSTDLKAEPDNQPTNDWSFFVLNKEKTQLNYLHNQNDQSQRTHYRPVIEIRFNWSGYEDGRWSSRKRTQGKVQLMYDWKYQDLYPDPTQLIEYDIQGNQDITISLSIISSNSPQQFNRCFWTGAKLDEKFKSIYDTIDQLSCDIYRVDDNNPYDTGRIGWCWLYSQGFPDRAWWDYANKESVTAYMKKIVTYKNEHVFPISRDYPHWGKPRSLKDLKKDINDYLTAGEPEKAIATINYDVPYFNLSYWLQKYPSACENMYRYTGFREPAKDSNGNIIKDSKGDIIFIDKTQKIILDKFVEDWGNIRWADIDLVCKTYRSLVINTRGIGQNVRMKFAEMKFSGYKLREEPHSFTGLMTKTSELETSEFDSVVDGKPIAYYPLYDLPTVFGHIYLFQLRDSTEYPALGFKVNSKANTLVLSSKESTPFCLRSINSENYSETKSYSLFDMSQRSAWLVGNSYNLLWWPGNYFAGKFQHFFFHDIKFCHELKRVEGDFSYECYPLYHPFIESFNNAIYNNSVVSSWDRFDELLTLNVQTKTEDFPYLPIPSDSIVKINPQDGINYHTVEFDFTQPFGLYNWEIFFHMPFTIAVRLSQNKQFEQAQRWFHYIFNPLKPVTVKGGNYTNEADRKAASYWNFWPLHQLGMPPKVDEKEIEARAIEVAKDPFNPHRIARARLGAYQKAVVIKYLDNLIAWGDHLFQQDTLETINEATHLYILAAKILGPRPKVLPKSQSLTAAQPSTPTLSEGELNPGGTELGELTPGGTEAVATDKSPRPGIPCDPTLGELTSYSEQLVDLDQLTWVDEQHLSAASLQGISSGIAQYISVQVFSTDYSTSNQSDSEPQTLQFAKPAFCIPHNDHLLSYWDTVADRLFKIRNCRNIAGEVRELPIFEPPIDPVLLVRGVALNVDISELLSDLYTPLPPYRFRVMLQKALEFCGDVQRLGGALLSALEKRDAEALSLLRSKHERQMLKLNESIRKQQIEELKETLKATQTSLVMAEGRFEYYSSREFENSNEKAEVILLNVANAFNISSQATVFAASLGYAFPNLHVPGFGPPIVETGGSKVGDASSAMSHFLGMIGSQLSHEAHMQSIQGSHRRRMDDWQFQAQQASKESVSATLTLQSSRIRKTISLTTSNGPNQQYGETVDDSRFNYDIRGIQSIATSTAQNDSGLFELNFNDDRYLPFEGAGAISTWRLELPTGFRQFDYNTISDVILHLRYTAQDGGGDLKDPANQEVARLLEKASAEVPLIRAFSAKQEFGSEWHQFLNPKATDASHKLDLAITPNRFPFQFRNKAITISKVEVFLKFKDIQNDTYTTKTPLGDYIAGSQKLGLCLVLPGDNNSQGLPMLTNDPLFQETPHATFDNLSHPVKATESWTLEAGDAQVGAIGKTLWTPVDGHNRLKAEAIDDLIILCHYSVSGQAVVQ